MKKSAQPADPLSSPIIYGFVVHVWRERAGSNRFVWRGSLTDVKSGSVKYFQSLPALAKLTAKILRSRLDEKGAASKE